MIVQYACENVRRGEGELKVGRAELSLAGYAHRVCIIEMNHLGFCDFSDKIWLIMLLLNKARHYSMSSLASNPVKFTLPSLFPVILPGWP